MYEIELKAHIADLLTVRKNVSTFATFKKHIDKSDVYLSYNIECSPKNITDTPRPYLTVRFRRETYDDGTTCDYFCYKRKELRDTTEVNDERECKVSDPYPLITAFTDIGFRKSLYKHKVSDLYTYSVPYGPCNIEICNVEGLGNFIEIEILCDNNDENLVKSVKDELYNILSRAGVSKDSIEPRYYKDLLNDLSNNN